MSMFAKLTLKSFIYDLCEALMFPNKKIKAIYDMCDIDFVYIYQILTDTDSTSLQFIFFSKGQCKIPEAMFRNITFLIIMNN